MTAKARPARSPEPLPKPPPAAATLLPAGWQAALFQPVDIASLAAFRMAFGAILLWEVYRYVHFGLIREVFLRPSMRFTYPGLEGLAPWPGPGLYLHFLVLGILAAMILVGLRYRLAMGLFTLGFAYVALLDKSQYLNHFYLTVLLGLLMCFTPAGRAWSLDAWLRPALATEHVPAWALWLLRFQVAVPYVYGGLAKLNGDWLHGQPMQIWMSHMTAVREYVPAFGELWLALVFSYGGLLLDLGIVPLLLWRRTRLIALAAAVAFHLMNAVMFQIGIFPWLMIAATTLFLPPDWPRTLIPSVRKRTTNPTNEDPLRTGIPIRSIRGFSSQAGLALAAAYIAVQLLLPLRHWIYPGHVDWTEEGTLFSWRMMLNDKPAAIRFMAVDPATGRASAVDPGDFLIPHQVERMSRDPEMLREFAAFVKRGLAEQGTQAEIRVLAIVSLNGRKPQLLIDPNIDLGAQPRTWWVQPWIVPLAEPRRWPPWPEPPSEWGKYGRKD